MEDERPRGAHDAAAAPDRARPACDVQRERFATAMAAGFAMAALLAVLTACSGGEPQTPAAAAVEACKNAAVQQFGLDDAGDVADPRALPVGDGDSFEVQGSTPSVDWVCTWLRTQSPDGVTVTTSIDER